VLSGGDCGDGQPNLNGLYCLGGKGHFYRRQRRNERGGQRKTTAKRGSDQPDENEKGICNSENLPIEGIREGEFAINSCGVMEERKTAGGVGGKVSEPLVTGRYKKCSGGGPGGK